MIQKKIKISTLALSIFVATNANAALYNVYEVTPDPSTISSNSYQSVFGVAVEPSTADSNVATSHDSCFLADSIGGVSCSTSSTPRSDFRIAGETRSQNTMAGQAVDGISYREEAPMGMDNEFVYVQTRDDLESYCSSELLYATCSSWADVHWAEWSKELSGDMTPNSIAFIESNTGDGVGALQDNSSATLNIVINSLTSSAEPIGIKSSLGDQRATVEALAVTSPTANSSYDKSRAWKTDGTYTVGSVSSNISNGNGDYYSSKAAIWKTDGTVIQLPWPSNKQNDDDRLAQGSMRDFTVQSQSGTIYGVGFNTYDSDNNYMNATVFKVAESDYADPSKWTSTVVQNAQVKIGGDYIYSNTVLTGVNRNLVAIGEAKRAGSRPLNGAAANRLFVVPDVSASTLNATFFSDSIEFSGAGGHANAINNYNEIVGQIDTESSREKNGKPRRKRAFIYPYNGTGSDTTRMAIFSNKAWLLDDLTNGDNATTSNNDYRILTASDINDAGVIAATAIKCAGGYDSTAHDSACSGRTETKVAVKLVPIKGATSSDIQPRSYTPANITRRAAAFDSVSLSLLSLLWFRRKKRFL